MRKTSRIGNVFIAYVFIIRQCIAAQVSQKNTSDQQLIYPEEVTHYHILIERPLNDSENRKEFLSDSDQNAPSRYDLMSLVKLGIGHTLAEHLDQLWNWFYTR